MRNIVSPLEGIRSPFGPRYGGFSPASLFAAGEQGVWYDPSDFSTMFQDVAGTTPVTAVEQPVGLLLDKSQGLAGTQQVADPSFDSGISGWGAQFPGSGVTYAWNSGLKSLTVTRGAGDTTGRPTYPVSIVSGTWYKISLTTNAAGVTNSAAFSVVNSFESAAIFSGSALGPQAIGATSKTIYALATSTTTAYIGIWCANNASADILSVEFTAVAGNHATQSTTTPPSRPVLSARVNLLTYSEQFDNAFWTKVNTTVTANAAVAPDGTTTADLLYPSTSGTLRYINRDTTGQITGTSFTTLIRIKAAGIVFAYVYNVQGNSLLYVNLTTGATSNVGSNISNLVSSIDANGWVSVSFNSTLTAGATANWYVGPCDASGSTQVTANGTSGIYIWGADLRPTNQTTLLPVYQRIAAATDYDTTGFPYYLKFDGTDDSMATGTITPGTDKAQVFAGVRKQSDAALGILAEYSTSAGAGSGRFFLAAPRTAATGDFAFNCGGTSIGSGAITPNSFPSPTTRILSGIGDISGDIATVRVNGTVEQTNTADQGTGNFGDYSLYIGRRGGASLPFNGNIYSLIVRFGANLDATTINNTETWVNGKTLAY